MQGRNRQRTERAACGLRLMAYGYQKQKKSRQRSTLPHSHPCSTIDAKELNYRVRDGIGCGLFAIITGKIVEAGKQKEHRVFQAISPSLWMVLQRGGEVTKPDD